MTMMTMINCSNLASNFKKFDGKKLNPFHRAKGRKNYETKINPHVQCCAMSADFSIKTSLTSSRPFRFERCAR